MTRKDIAPCPIESRPGRRRRSSRLYVLAGVVFALLFLPRGVARLDPRVAGAPKTLRLLILPGVVGVVAAVCLALDRRAPTEKQPASSRRQSPHSDAKAGCAMIRPLRRRHRWIIPTLLALLLVVAAALALTHPAPSARVDRLPPAIVSAEAIEDVAMSTTYRAVAWNPQKRRYDMVAAGLIARRFSSVALGLPGHAASGADDRNAADPGARRRGVHAAARHPLHRPAGATGPPIPPAPLQPSPSRRDDVHAGAGARRVLDRPVPCARDAQSARERARQQRSLRDDQPDPVPAVWSGGARHPVSDGGHEPRLLAAQPHGAGVEDAAHGRVRGLCPHRAARDLRRPAGRDQPAPRHGRSAAAC